MNKKDLIPVILLALLIPLWMLIDRALIAPKFPAKTPAPAAQTAPQTPAPGNIENATLSDAVAVAAPTEVKEAPASVMPVEEQVETLENKDIHVELTSIGGGVKSVTFISKDADGTIKYPELNEDDSPPVVIDFSGSTALAYEGLSGIGVNDALHIRKSEDGQSVTFSKAWNANLVFQRTISIDEHYVLAVRDRFINNSSNPWNVPGIRIKTGYMGNPADTEAMKGVSILGVDSYSSTGGVNYWGKKLSKLFKEANKAERIDTVPEEMYNQTVDWVAAKNKFFTQILRPADPVATMSILANRNMNEKGIIPDKIAAVLAFKPAVVNPGQSLDLDYSYYVGPKNYSILKETGNNMEKVMEFETTGFFSFMNWLMEPSRKFLLWTMNMFYGVIPNYGVAIIILTLLIRILFWPLTHKSTESMKRMQEIQPLVKELQTKHKKDPQRLQQETMKLYKEHKVNPMGGCLPMFVQIPVFIALFTVLRNAIELRYSGFLWISDLSQPENLFAGSIPFVGSLNILPLLMSGSMIWQQKLSSPGTAATPEQQQQQKMMMFMMPIMMLFFFYSMPSGLVLYWTTSNLLMIAQTGMRNIRAKKKEA